ncbi:hypothetical protein [Yoonia sp.]|uniref:hypothetical protein n=1 Tax=Yoonia sp. TaxID=2212373 RepID=UPI002397BDE6|nr:hypothetical protein [Yoonia sp.]MDE0852774.1 hypothetical protein [Yoonia sp.]
MKRTKEQKVASAIGDTMISLELDPDEYPELMELMGIHMCSLLTDIIIDDEPEPKIQNYHVEWSIDVEAHSPQEAAEKALVIQRDNDPKNTANVFKCTSEDGDQIIDLGD